MFSGQIHYGGLQLGIDWLLLFGYSLMLPFGQQVNQNNPMFVYSSVCSGKLAL